MQCSVVDKKGCDSLVPCVGIVQAIHGHVQQLAVPELEHI